LWFKHGLEFIIAFYGAILAGAIAVPLPKPRGGDWRLFESIVASSAPRAVLTAASQSNCIPSAIVQAYHLDILELECVDQNDGASYRDPGIGPKSTAFIQFTSGSTSSPKGVVISHANVLHNLEVVRDKLALTTNDIGVSWLPFHHDMGLINHVLQPLYSHIHNYHLSPLSFVARPSCWLEAMARYRGTISGGPNFAYELCCGKIPSGETFDLSRWRVAYCGSELVSPATVESFVTRFASSGFCTTAFYPCYGLAESTLFVCGTDRLHCERLDPSGRRYVRIGEFDSNSMALVDDQTLEIVDSEKRVGEVWLKSPSIGSGYYKDPRQTASAFFNRCSRGSEYFRTGDLGFTCEGGLYLVGRRNNRIKIRGQSIYGEDIEAQIARVGNAIGIARSAAFSIHGEDSELLVVLLEDEGQLGRDAARAATLEVDSLVCELFNVRPHAIKVVSKNVLPLTTSGKIRRSLCRERFLDGLYS
jgi:acyl-CoA synthetase (AMP-forming)/AMP-acid ligase II